MKVAVIVLSLVTVAVLLSSAVRADDLAVAPASVTIQLAGGSSTVRNLTVDWSGQLVTAARLFTNVTPNATGLSFNYSVPIWNNYIFLLPGTHVIRMTIDTDPSLEPCNYTITTDVEVMENVKFLIQNNTVSVVDPSQATANNALEQNLTALYLRFIALQNDKNDINSRLNNELANSASLRALTLGLAIFILLCIGTIVVLIRRRRDQYDHNDENMPNGVSTIEDEPNEDGLNIVPRRSRR